MSYGDARWNGWAMDTEESLDLIKKAYDAGINFFDTANVYSNGKSEEILGKAIKPNPRTQFKDPALVNRCGLSRKHVFDACDASLKRLGLDYIDLYQIHRFDKCIQTVEALHDLVKYGKVRYIGASSMHAWEFQKANHIAEKNGWTKFISMQNLYNLLYREEEREVIPYSLDAGIGGIPWSPLAFGVLECKNRNTTRSQNDLAVGLLQIRESDQKIFDRLVEVAERKKASPAQIALAWLLSKSFVTAPIVGITKAEYLDDAVGALKINLTEDECQYLEESYASRPLIPM
ncbi:hypothetical protein O0I10_008340 [Lichtheimia ornata]|uniref:NADP-dependent oxidoreductase domain-containing protein n=1 Tax=Lichtheimia ornata TaxID=688661 RepID=A0AAD7UZ78_9FUNG|nr:uncharacterized protein O0I10_008340 [Lichtheimia ornata]KAJ8655900.1 hypothetical protein O0I10_008340 [Lichtheimia ornata]